MFEILLLGCASLIKVCRTSVPTRPAAVHEADIQHETDIQHGGYTVAYRNRSTRGTRGHTSEVNGMNFAAVCGRCYLSELTLPEFSRWSTWATKPKARCIVLFWGNAMTGVKDEIRTLILKGCRGAFPLLAGGF